MAKLIPKGAKGVDYSWARPDPALLVADGIEYAARYTGPNPLSGKVIKPTELATLHAHGIVVLIVDEGGPADGYSGRPGGLIRGARAKAYCQKVLGMPFRYPIIVAFDTDTTPGNIDIFEIHGRAVAEACAPYPIWVYGDRDIIERLSDVSEGGWLANASWWSRLWSKLLPAPHVTLQQLSQSADHTVDYNIARQPFYGWDGSPDVILPPTPTPVPDVVPVPAPSKGVIPMDVVTNASDWDTGAAGTVKFALQYAGQALYHLSPVEWIAGGQQAGVSMSNDQLNELAAIPVPTQPLAAIDYNAVAAKVAPLIPVTVVDPEARAQAGAAQLAVNALIARLKAVVLG